MTPVVVSPKADADVDNMLERLAGAILSPYVVVYDYVDEMVRIVRVLEGRRNITRRLARE